MPSIIKKKTNYESTGFVRRMLKKGASLKSLNSSGGGDILIKSSNRSTSFRRLTGGEGTKWRPRKNQFERLDCGDEDDDCLSGLSASFKNDNASSSWDFDNGFPSTAIKSVEPQKDKGTEQLVSTAFVNSQPKQNLSGEAKKRAFSPLKPSNKDSSKLRSLSSCMKKTVVDNPIHGNSQGKKEAQEYHGFNEKKITTPSTDPFFSTLKEPTTMVDSFGFNVAQNKNSTGMNVSSKENGEESRTSTHEQTDLRSQEFTPKLTVSNLAKMDSSFTNDKNNVQRISSADGMERLVKERKFYQFAIDEDKASTVVESTIQLPADYPGGEESYGVDDDDTECSCSQTSQGTRIQQRSTTMESKSRGKNIAKSSDVSKKEIEQSADSDMVAGTSRNETLASDFDSFFPEQKSSEEGYEKTFPSVFSEGVNKNEPLFPEFEGGKEIPYKLATGSDISSSFGDAYFERSYKSSNDFSGSHNVRQGRSQDRKIHQISTKSLSYSPSPVHKKAPLAAFSPSGRQPLTLKNIHSSGGKPTTFMSNFGTENTPRKDASFQFDDFHTSTATKKRNSSIGSGNFQVPPADPFNTLSNQADTKENYVLKSNRNDDFNDVWRRNQKQRYPLRRNDEDENDDDDSFDDINKWEKPVFGDGMTDYPRRTNSETVRNLVKRAHSTYNRAPSRNRYIDDNYVDEDNKSVGGFSVEKVSRPFASSSYTKPLAFPNNAIVGSMLFRTHYDIDQNDVQQKINKFEAENSRQKEIRHRHGDIPDAVDADADHMTTVSSFSEGTSAYMHDSWRKPSRDLLNHFTSARALDMDYPSTRRLPIRQRLNEEHGLFEA